MTVHTSVQMSMYMFMFMFMFRQHVYAHAYKRNPDHKWSHGVRRLVVSITYLSQ